jgi:periplasmic protein TonB
MTFITRIYILILFLNLTLKLYSQNLNINDTAMYTQDHLTVQPEPKNGFADLSNYITKNIKFEMKNVDWCGYGAKVWIGFVVEKDSTLTNFEIIKGNCPTYDNPILELFKEMPKWKPGEINGKKVRSKFIMPIHLEFQ